MGIPAGSPSTNAVAVVYGGIAFSIDSTGDTYLDMYGIGSGSYGHYCIDSPDIIGPSYAKNIHRTGIVLGNTNGSVVDSYGRRVLSGT